MRETEEVKNHEDFDRGQFDFRRKIKEEFAIKSHKQIRRPPLLSDILKD